MNTNREIARLGGQGILTEQDLPSLSKAQQAIMSLMGDGNWHPASRIIEICGQREGLRRLRDLRSKGYTVERRRSGESRDFEYQIVQNN